MLTIENVHKAYRMDIAGYRIGKVESTPDAYRFHLMRYSGHTVIVSLLRAGNINSAGDPEYTMWCQTGGGGFRGLDFTRKDFLSPAAFLMALHVLIV